MDSQELLRRDFERHLDDCGVRYGQLRDSIKELHTRIDAVGDKLGDARVRSVERLNVIYASVLGVAILAIGFLLARHGI